MDLMDVLKTADLLTGKNIIDLLHIVLGKKTKTQKLNFDHGAMKMRSRSDDTCQLDMYTL